MAHISNFSKFKLMLENNSVNYFHILNEDATKDMMEIGNNLQGGDSLEPLGSYGKMQERIKAVKEVFDENAGTTWIKNIVKSVKNVTDIDNDLFGTQGVFPAGVSSNDNTDIAIMLVASSLAGSGRKLKEFKNNQMDFSFSKAAEYDITFTPAKGEGQMVKCNAKVENDNGTALKDLDKQTSENLRQIKYYINNFSMVALASNGDSYGPNSINENGFFDFNEISSDGFRTFYIIKQKEKEIASRDEKTTTERVGYEPALRGQADIAFKNGSFNISDDPKGQIKIDALAKVIAEKFKDKTFDQFNLISSASPVWAGKETMADYKGKPTKGTGNPGKGNDFATKNYELAYNRGEAIMKALNASLKKLGHAGIPNYTITWQIADKGGPENTGRFVDLLISSPENQGKLVTKTEITGKVEKEAKTIEGQYMLYAYEFV